MRRWHPAVVLAAAFAVYANCLGHAFVWDDQYLVVDNPQIKDWRRIASLFVSDLFPPVMPSGYYRPLQALSNLIDYQMWGLSPAGFHLTNIALHAATALMLYTVAVGLLGRARAAVIAALLFVVHPIHTEAVAYVSGRSDPLAALLLLAALWGFSRYGRTEHLAWLGASLTCFALALLAREASLALLFLLPLIDATNRSRHEPVSLARLGRRLLPYAGVLLAYVLVRRAVIDMPALVGPPGDTGLGWRLLTMLNVLGQYGALLVAPVNLHMERRVPVATSFIEPSVIAGFVFVAALMAIAVRVRQRAWPVTLGIAWFLLALIPVANLWPLATFMAEHWLYVPSMGLFLVAGWGIDRLMGQGERSGTQILAVMAIVALGAATVLRNRDWRGPIPLYEATTRSAPQSARAWTNLAHAYRDAGRVEAARSTYERALQVMATNPPHVARSRGNSQEAQEQALVGNIEQQRGRFAEAEARYRAALALDPTLASVFNNLGLTLGALGRPNEAEDSFVSAVRLYPDFAAAHSNLGNVRFRRGELEAAKTDYLTAIRLNPEYAEAYNNLGSVYFRLGVHAQAVAAYRRALQLKPELEEVRRNLAVVESAHVGAAGDP